MQEIGGSGWQRHFYIAVATWQMSPGHKQFLLAVGRRLRAGKHMLGPTSMAMLLLSKVELLRKRGQRMQ